MVAFMKAIDYKYTFFFFFFFLPKHGEDNAEHDVCVYLTGECSVYTWGC